MTKKIALIIGVAVLLFTGCTSNGHCDTSSSPRFVGIVSGNDSGLFQCSVVVDIETGVEYAVIYGKSMTPLLDADGKPLKYNAETGDVYSPKLMDGQIDRYRYTAKHICLSCGANCGEIQTWVKPEFPECTEKGDE